MCRFLSNFRISYRWFKVGHSSWGQNILSLKRGVEYHSANHTLLCSFHRFQSNYCDHSYNYIIIQVSTSKFPGLILLASWIKTFWMFKPTRIYLVVPLHHHHSIQCIFIFLIYIYLEHDLLSYSFNLFFFSYQKNNMNLKVQCDPSSNSLYAWPTL